MNTEEKLDNHEMRIGKLEADGGRLDERLKSVADSLLALKWIVVSITLLSLATVIYGAIGEKGLHAVRNTVASTTTTMESSK